MSTPAHIIIVDDQPSARELLKGFLQPEGYRLSLVKSGAELLNMLDKELPDAILLDVMMPDINGFEICHRIKANPAWKHIPIILITALDGKEDIARGLNVGADDFIHKPVNRLELLARVRSMLRTKKLFDELQAALQLKEDMTYMLVHDMRTPLTAILGYVQLLKNQHITIDREKCMTEIANQTQELNLLVNEILTVARIEHGNMIINPDWIDLKDLLETAIEKHQFVARSRQIKLVSHLPDVSRKTLFDSTLFFRVIDNLLANAIKFSPLQGEVVIQLEYPRLPEPGIKLTISDNGPGIAEPDRERIFNKFEVIKIKESGILQTGLGLAFCKMVVEAHNGKIYVQANQPQGSAFVIEI